LANLLISLNYLIMILTSVIQVTAEYKYKYKYKHERTKIN